MIRAHFVIAAALVSWMTSALIGTPVEAVETGAFSGISGPLLRLSGDDAGGALSIAGRYRIGRYKNKLNIFAEAGGFKPFGRSKIGSADHQTYGATDDTASLKLHFQVHMALVAELPHGLQQQTIPELGLGAALTSSEISYTNALSTGDEYTAKWSPYFHAGLRFFADRTISLLLNATYTIDPYNKTTLIAIPAHNQTFDYPHGIWTLGTQVVVKLGPADRTK